MASIGLKVEEARVQFEQTGPHGRVSRQIFWLDGKDLLIIPFFVLFIYFFCYLFLHKTEKYG